MCVSFFRSLVTIPLSTRLRTFAGVQTTAVALVATSAMSSTFGSSERSPGVVSHRSIHVDYGNVAKSVVARDFGGFSTGTVVFGRSCGRGNRIGTTAATVRVALGFLDRAVMDADNHDGLATRSSY